jgi:hypothetical protein
MNTYTGYSISCAGVWAVILAIARRRLDGEAWNRVWRGCLAWWIGWTSATIARAVYPAPRKLGPEGKKRLRIASLVLMAVGVVNVSRVLAAGRHDGDTDAYAAGG